MFGGRNSNHFTTYPVSEFQNLIFTLVASTKPDVIPFAISPSISGICQESIKPFNILMSYIEMHKRSWIYSK